MNINMNFLSYKFIIFIEKKYHNLFIFSWCKLFYSSQQCVMSTCVQSLGVFVQLSLYNKVFKIELLSDRKGVLWWFTSLNSPLEILHKFTVLSVMFESVCFSSPLSTLSTETFIGHHQLDRQKEISPYFLLYMKVVDIIHLHVVTQIIQIFTETKNVFEAVITDFLPSLGPDCGSSSKRRVDKCIE